MTSFVDKVLLVDETLTAASVPHAFGGAIALAYAVMSPRATDDIDVNIAVPLADAERVLRELSRLANVADRDLEAVQRDGQVRIRWLADRTPIDLFFPQHEFHRAVAAGARPVPFSGRALTVISPTHLAVFKVLFNRTKDWPDIEAMLGAGSIDAEEVLRWLDRLVGPDDPLSRRFALLSAATPLMTAHPDMERPSVDWKALKD